MASPTRIVIFVDKPDWHARRLCSAFATRGVEAVFRSLSLCGFAVGGATGLAIRGFEDALGLNQAEP